MKLCWFLRREESQRTQRKTHGASESANSIHLWHWAVIYGGPKGPTQTKKENTNKKEHIIKEIKKTQTKKNTSPNKKRKRTQKSTTQAKKYKTQTKKHNANKKAKRKQKTQLKLHQSHVNYVHFNGFVLRFYSCFLALYKKR